MAGLHEEKHKPDKKQLPGPLSRCLLQLFKFFLRACGIRRGVGWCAMKTIALDLPDPLADPLADALERAVKESGCAAQELAREALRNFLLHGQFALQEQHQLEDVATALREAGLAV